jgi:putative heme-binding domain-containing protein
LRIDFQLGCLAVLMLLVSATAPAQSGNPFEGDPEAIRAGGPLYAARCADCHSADAAGARGPNLLEHWASGGTDLRVFDAVRTGIEGSIMPPSFAADDEIWAIVAYLRSISTVPPFDPGAGDPDRGRAIFENDCADCHAIAGSGGRIGPDLTRIAVVRSREALVRSIREPSGTVSREYRAARLVTDNGTRIEGIVKGEDAFSLQVVDTDARLQGYLKSSLRSLEISDDSLMPRFGRARLSERELGDLLAYLASLRSNRENIQ